ncbi:hypothetical protein H5T89_05085, partial [bacterium]|nr:hypothetical protein [bacterium]
RLIEWDRFNYSGGSLVRAHLILSYYRDKKVKKLKLKCLVKDKDEVLYSKENTIRKSISPGDVEEIDIIEFITPTVRAPRRLKLEVSLDIDGELVENYWFIWVYPNADIEKLQIFDSKGIIRFNIEEPKENIFVSTELNKDILDSIHKGAKVLYVQPEEGKLKVSRKPFFRESIQVLFDHPIIRRFCP